MNLLDKGWECPKCGAVMSPTTSRCVNCRGYDGFTINRTVPNVPTIDELLKKAKAEEIFEEIERETKNHGITYTQRKIAELKKKYIGEDK